MIVELFSSMVEGAFKRLEASDLEASDLTLDNMKPVFDRMDLPMPNHDIDISVTREGGYNLMLNRYGSVLRIYPSDKKLEQLRDPELAPYVKRTTHLYDEINVTPIGLVQFDGVVVQLMAGLVHDERIDQSQALEFEVSDNSAGKFDYNPDNFGRIPESNEIKNFDTIGGDGVCIDNYGEYYEAGLLDKLIEESKLYEDLQQGFVNAWSDKKSFNEFWKDMEQATCDGRLVAGWLDTHMEGVWRDSIVPKGDIIALSKAYDRKLEQHLAMKNGIEVEVEVEEELVV